MGLHFKYCEIQNYIDGYLDQGRLIQAVSAMWQNKDELPEDFKQAAIEKAIHIVSMGKLHPINTEFVKHRLREMANTENKVLLKLVSP